MTNQLQHGGRDKLAKFHKYLPPWSLTNVLLVKKLINTKNVQPDWLRGGQYWPIWSWTSSERLLYVQYTSCVQGVLHSNISVYQPKVGSVSLNCSKYSTLKEQSVKSKVKSKVTRNIDKKLLRCAKCNMANISRVPYFQSISLQVSEIKAIEAHAAQVKSNMRHK